MKRIRKNGKLVYVKPLEVVDDDRFNVNIIYLADGTGYLDHRLAARAWDEYNEEHPLSRKETESVNA